MRRLLQMVLVCGLPLLGLVACKEPAPAPKQVEEKPPYNPEKAHKLAVQRIAALDVASPPLTKNSDYIQIHAAPGPQPRSAEAFLSGITSDQTKTAIILARFNAGEGISLPARPLFIFEKKQERWTNRFQADGPLTSYFVTQHAPLSVSLDMVLLQDLLPDLDVAAHDFAQRISAIKEVSFQDIAHAPITYLNAQGTVLNLIGATGEMALSLHINVKGKTSLFPFPPSKPVRYSEILNFQIKDQTPRSVLGDLEARFWNLPLHELAPNCRAIQKTLQERLGVSPRDSALVLFHMMQSHTLFAENLDYRKECAPDATTALFENMGLELPTKETSDSISTNAMNSTLSTIVRLFKNTKDETAAKFTNLMHGPVTIHDEARLLFTEDPNLLVEGTSHIVGPSLSSEQAADFLMMLPVQSYGCYSRGSGQLGNYRAALLTLENDPDLWQINFSFYKSGIINGIQLHKPSQLEYCRAVGGRTGQNRCKFTQQTYPGLSADRCG